MVSKVNYTFKRKARLRRMRISIQRNAEVVVSAPRWVPKFVIENFVKKHAVWIKEKVDFIKNQGQVVQKGGKREYQKYKKQTLEYVAKKVEELNKAYNFSYQNITVRNQKTRWGSCSKKGNLNFNYRIFFLSPKLAEYIIVHELCHLQEFNHSKNFWNLVAKTIPDFQQRRKQLKNNLL